MTDATEIVFDGMQPSPYLTALIVREIGKLERFYGDVVAADIRVEARSGNAGLAQSYAFDIALRLRDGRAVAPLGTLEHHHRDTDFHIALRAAFAEVRGRLQQKTGLLRMLMAGTV